MLHKKRERDLTYRIGDIGGFPYLSVKLHGEYFFIGEAPRLAFEDMLSALHDIERDNEDFWRKLPAGSDHLAIRIYEMLIWMKDEAIAALGIDDKGVASLGAYSERPNNLKEEQLAELAAEVVGKCIQNDDIVARLDERFWTHDVAVEDGRVIVPMPAHVDPNDKLQMIDRVLRG